MNVRAIIQSVKVYATSEQGLFFAIFFGATIIFSSLIIICVILIDPHEDFGTGLIEPIVLTNRTLKLKSLSLMNPKPELLIFGSSRTFTFDPDIIMQRLGKQTFNASVSYARSEDYYALLRYSVEELHITPKTLLIGFIPAEFNNDPFERQLLNNKQLGKYVENNPAFSPFFILKTIKEKLNARLVNDSIKSFLFHTTRTQFKRVAFLENGKQDTIDTPYSESAITSQYQHAKKLYQGISEPPISRLNYFKKTIDYASDHHIKIILAILPIHPDIATKLKLETPYNAFTASLMTYLNSFPKNTFTLYDFSDISSFNGEKTGFNDPTHMDVENVLLITNKLFPEKK